MITFTSAFEVTQQMDREWKNMYDFLYATCESRTFNVRYDKVLNSKSFDTVCYLILNFDKIINYGNVNNAIYYYYKIVGVDSILLFKKIKLMYV